MQQYQEEYEPEEKPKNIIISKISGAIAIFLDRLLYVIIGIIIGAGGLAIVQFFF